MSFFDYKGKNIFYEDIGIGAPLLLLHGNTASSKMFTPIVPVLTEQYRVITMDFLGCGQSDRLTNWDYDLWFQWSQQAIAEDEMFPKGHYEKLFELICSETEYATKHIFEHGGHPAMMSNAKEFIPLCVEFFLG